MSTTSFNTVLNNVDKLVVNFTDSISQKYNLSKSDLMSLWGSTNPPKQATATGTTCDFILTRGTNKGNKCANKCTAGSTYCSRHKDLVTKNGGSAPAATQNTTTSEIKKKVSAQKSAHGNYIFPDTKYVIDKVLKKVSAVELDDGQLRPLTDAEENDCQAKGIPVVPKSELHQETKKEETKKEETKKEETKKEEPKEELKKETKKEEHKEETKKEELKEEPKEEHKKEEPKEEHKKEEKCQAILQAGANKGQPCGVKVSVKSKTGQYCGRHCDKLETQ